MIEKTLHENEIKTNVGGVKALLTLAIAMAVYIILDLVEAVDIAPVWTIYVISACTLIIFAVCIFIKAKGFDKPYVKTIILAALIIYSGILYFMFPVTSVFFLFGPILVSISYYDERFTLQISVLTWLIYILIVMGNSVLEYTSEAVHEYHVFQEMNIWQYPLYVFLYYGIVRTILFVITTIIAMRIVRNGKKMIVTQDEMYRKTSELESDLDAAARIQNSTMPAPGYTTENGRVRIYAGIDPAKDVGGDFYDRFKVDENVMCTVVADVSDKGITAAMFSMRALTAIRFIIKEMALRGDMDLAVAVSKMNKLLVHNNGEDMFVTVWIGCIDSRTGMGKYVNAGHMPPVIRHSDGETELLESEPQLMLGMFGDAEYKASTFRMNDGDSLILYTDGITDARNADDEVFGMERLISTIEAADPETYRDPQKTYSYLAETVDSFTEGNTQFDDETIMVVNYDGTSDALTGRINIAVSDEADAMDIPAATDLINSGLKEKHCPEDVRRNIDVIIDEIGTNVIDYGFEDVPVYVHPQSDDDRISEDEPELSHPQFMINYEIGDNYIVLEFRDNGMQFDPTAAQEPDLDGEPRIGGMGIHLVRNLSDDLAYRYDEGRNVLTVKKIWGM